MILEALDTPWKITNLLLAWMGLPIVRIQFASNHIVWRKGWRFYGVPVIQKHRLSSMCFGDGLQLRSTLPSNPLGVNHRVILATLHAQAKLCIGDRFAMTGGTLCAAQCIEIGDDVNIGANSMVVDTDFHPLRSDLRALHPQNGDVSPVVIGDRVFIGASCIILKGVTIGSGSVVGAGSIVTKSVPPNVVVAGNPARILREI